MTALTPVGGSEYCALMTQDASTHTDHTDTDNADTAGEIIGSAADREQPDTIGGARPDPSTTASKDPDEWVTGDEPMTGPQRSYLDTLAREAGEELPADLTKAEASQHIDRLQGETGRGAGSGSAGGSEAAGGAGR